MNITFKSLTIHHFLSFDEATIDLSDRGFCLVSGINRNPKDAAKSNGSGKSTIWNAISFVLTGETIQGLKSNLGNIYFDDGCWVSLEFTMDGHEYKLLRSKDDSKYGTNLKIIVDGEDKSGKGIRESEEILSNLLPDITSELIGSVIIIGQGMPQRFTNNTPSKRKEILEHLSKSDYMIQDLKVRVENRSIELTKKLREVDDGILSNTSKKKVYESQLESAKAELIEATKPTDYDNQISEINGRIAELNAKISKLSENEITIRDKVTKANEDYTSISKKRQDALDQVRTQHEQAVRELNDWYIDVNSKLTAVTQEIARLESIKDVCPTCGQKIPGAIKPDTTEQRKSQSELTEALAKVKTEKELDAQEYQKIIVEIGSKFDAQVTACREELTKLQSEQYRISSEKSTTQQALVSENSLLTKVTSQKENHESNIKRIETLISNQNESIAQLNKIIEGLTGEQSELNKHLEVISKMNTYLKRDFRGYLLTNIIDYISIKAKEYSGAIFGCDEITFALNGNNIDISYCGKDYENLSGGEKQRVDLIIQFALRSMLCNHLGFNSNILVLDEITDNLDSVSCEKVLNFITAELNSIESVFIISHHSDELAIPCDSEIVVEKNTEGVSHVI